MRSEKSIGGLTGTAIAELGASRESAHPLELRHSKIRQEVLQVDARPDDNFFDLGDVLNARLDGKPFADDRKCAIHDNGLISLFLRASSFEVSGRPIGSGLEYDDGTGTRKTTASGIQAFTLTMVSL